MKLKDFVTAALRAAVERPFGEAVAEPEPGLEPGPEKDEIVLGEDCVFPLIRGEGGPALQDLTHRNLEDLDRGRD